MLASCADIRTTDGRPYNAGHPDKLKFSGLTAAKNIRNKVLFSVLSLEGKNQRNFEKTTIAKRQKSLKLKKHRNERVHFCAFCL